MWNTSVYPGPELETILAVPISLQLENESGQFLKTLEFFNHPFRGDLHSLFK